MYVTQLSSLLHVPFGGEHYITFMNLNQSTGTGRNIVI